VAQLHDNDFIEASESRLFLTVFRIYTRLLFKRRFRRVHLNNRYNTVRNRSTLYYLNHSTWWDALIPFMLNEYHFKQNARALMDIEQLKKYRFFRKIGAFSIDRQNPRSALYSMNKTREWLGLENSSIYFFPEGSIRNEFDPIQFEHGIGWLARECKQTDLVPIAIHINLVRSDKPDLFIDVGEPVCIGRENDKRSITDHCRSVLAELLDDLRRRAFDQNEEFGDFF
jgi:1-acyl-sn-glycerol-3-phosphate acyltransferase